MDNEITVALNARRMTRMPVIGLEDKPSRSISHGWSSLIAGYVAGSAGLLIGHPLDSLKVLIQTQGQAPVTSTQQTTTPASTSRNAGPASSNTKTIASSLAPGNTSGKKLQQQTRGKAVAAFPLQSKPLKRTFGSLYAGIGTPLLSVGIIQSLNFFLYDQFRRRMYSTKHEILTGLEYLDQDSIANVSTAAFAAGGIISVVTSPLQVLKTIQQLYPQHSMKGALKHVSGGTFDLSRSSRGLFVGFAPHLYCETFGRGVYFGVYETIKRYMTALNREKYQQDGLSLHQRMAAASVAGMTSWTVIYPMDVVRCRMYALLASSAQSQMLSVYQVMADMYQNGGNSIKPFFRGFGLTIIRAGPVAAVVLPVYDITLQGLNNSW